MFITELILSLICWNILSFHKIANVAKVVYLKSIKGSQTNEIFLNFKLNFKTPLNPTKCAPSSLTQKKKIISVSNFFVSKNIWHQFCYRDAWWECKLLYRRIIGTQLTRNTSNTDRYNVLFFIFVLFLFGSIKIKHNKLR